MTQTINCFKTSVIGILFFIQNIRLTLGWPFSIRRSLRSGHIKRNALSLHQYLLVDQMNA